MNKRETIHQKIYLHGMLVVVIAALLAFIPVASAAPVIPVPDLTVSNLNEELIDPSNPSLGYRILYTITNPSDFEAGESVTCLIIDGLAIASQPCPALAAGASHSGAFDGPFYCSDVSDSIEVCADCEANVEESDEGNNCLGLEVECPGMPDLVVDLNEMEWIEPGNPMAGYRVGYTIANQGDSEAGESVTCLAIDGLDIATQLCPALAAGASHSGVFDGPFYCSDVSDSIEVCADCEGNVAESDEENNCLGLELVCPGMPDLVVDLGETELVEPGNPMAGYRVGYSITNQGDSDADPTDVRLVIDAGDMGAQPCPALAAGSSHSGVFEGPFYCSDENDIIIICADFNENVVESNETNNCLEFGLSCPGMPDLVVEINEEWISPGNPMAGYTVIYTITNQGLLNAGSSNTHLTIDGGDQGTQPCPALAAGASHSGAFDGPFYCSEENDAIIVCADDDDSVGESNEANNCDADELPCPGMPDLIITISEEWIVPGNPMAGYMLNYTVTNQGDLDAGSSNTCLTIDGGDQGTQPCPALAAGASHSGVFDGPFYCSEEDDIIIACADCDNSVIESVESNNCDERILLCQGMPDLVISEKAEEWVDPNNPSLGYRILYTVSNTGSEASSVSITSVFIDGSPVPGDTQSCPALDAGAIYQGIFNGPFYCTGSSDTITVCADFNENVVESNETNNCLTNELPYPGMPDLIVEKDEEWIDENDPAQGYIVNFTVSNQGDENSGANSVSLVIDGVFEPFETCPQLEPGNSFSGTFAGPFYCTGDIDTIEVCVDCEGIVIESNEENNCMINEWTCPGFPDLIVNKSEQWIDEEDHSQGYLVSYTVTNTGNALSGSSNTELIIDNTIMDTQSCPSLVEGGSHEGIFSGPFFCSSDRDLIEVCADTDDAVQESNEENNCMDNEWSCEIMQESYGESVDGWYRVCRRNKALHEPDNRGATILRNGWISIEFEKTIFACTKISLVAKARRGCLIDYPEFEIYVSADGSNWIYAGEDRCNKMYQPYEFTGDFGDVRYIKVKRNIWGTMMRLDSVYAEKEIGGAKATVFKQYNEKMESLRCGNAEDDRIQKKLMSVDSIKVKHNSREARKIMSRKHKMTIKRIDDQNSAKSKRQYRELKDMSQKNELLIKNIRERNITKTMGSITK